MNDTGGGVTAIHDVPGDITRIGFHWMLLFPFCHSKGGLLFCLHTECLGGHGFPCYHELSNYRIFSHGESRRSRIFLSRFFPLSRICEFFLHTECCGGHGVSLSRDLSLDPLTNGR